MSHDRLHKILELVQEELKEAGSQGPRFRVDPSSGNVSIGSAPAGLTALEIIDLTEISSKIGTLQSTFAMVYDDDFPRQRALDLGEDLKGKAYLLATQRSGRDPVFEEIAKLIKTVKLDQELLQNRGQGVVLQQIKNLADEHLSNVVEGDTDVAGDMVA